MIGASNLKTTLHGVLVNVANIGVLITGESETGKSACALELLSIGHKLIADDVVEITKIDDRLLGSAPERFAGLLEIRGLGIVDIRRLFSESSFAEQSVIDLKIEFGKTHSGESFDRLGSGTTKGEILGVMVPEFFYCIDGYVNARLFVETAVKLSKIQAAVVATDLALLTTQSFRKKF